MPIIKQGELLAINAAADGDIESTMYEATRQFNWEDAFNECVRAAKEQQKECDTPNRFDGELFIAEWLLAEGCIKRVPIPQHLITVSSDEYTFNK